MFIDKLLPFLIFYFIILLYYLKETIETSIS